MDENTKVNESIDLDLVNLTNSVNGKLEEDINSIHLINALDHIFDIFRRCNKYIDETMPWVLAKDEEKKFRLETVIYNLLESIRVGANLLSPFLPETSDKILEQLNNYERKEEIMEENTYNLGTPRPLFMRIEKNEE